MTEHDVPDEILMAYADGELDDQSAQELAARLPGDAVLAARLALFTGTRDALAPQRPAEPIPDALMARVRATLKDAAGTDPASTDNVIHLARSTPPAAPVPQPATPRWQPMALAASLALAVGLGGGFWAANMLPVPQGDPARLILLDAEGLAPALTELASGDRRSLASGEVAIIASFRDADGRVCREFEYDAATGNSIVSVVCHGVDGWHPRLVIATGPQDSSGYAPASSLDTLDAYLSAIGAGAPLSAAEEQDALRDIRD